ncbi:hypothetical protein Tco_1214239 [Tanacetum coccineum]
MCLIFCPPIPRFIWISTSFLLIMILDSDLDVSSPFGDRNKIYDPGICIEVESTRFLATLSPVIDTLLPFSFENKDKVSITIQRISLTGFPAQSVESSNTDVLDLPCLLVLVTGTSQGRQHVTFAVSLMMTLEGFPFVIVNTKEYHSECSGRITRIMRRTLVNSL